MFSGNIYLINNVSYLPKRKENARDFISFGILKGMNNHTVSRNRISWDYISSKIWIFIRIFYLETYFGNIVENYEFLQSQVWIKRNTERPMK